MTQALRRAASNEQLNKLHYDERYKVTDVDRLVATVEQMPAWLADQVSTHNSWRSFYHGGLADRLAGARVLELGAGDGLNALVMASLGAHVVATDISEMTPKLVHAARERLDLAGSIEGHGGPIADWADMIEPRSFDFVVGKQQIVWGTADKLPILDVVDPFDFREFVLPEFADARVPLWSVLLRRTIGDFEVEAFDRRFPSVGTPQVLSGQHCHAPGNGPRTVAVCPGPSSCVRRRANGRAATYVFALEPFALGGRTGTMSPDPIGSEHP